MKEINNIMSRTYYFISFVEKSNFVDKRAKSKADNTTQPHGVVIHYRTHAFSLFLNFAKTDSNQRDTYSKNYV